MKALVILALLLSGPVAAGEVLIDKGLGDADPRPEALIVFDDRIRMGARVVFDGSDALAAEVATTRMMMLEAGFITSGDVAPEDVRLRCRIRFVDADGTMSRVIRSSTCFKGNLGAVAGQWVPLQIDLRFKPVATDPSGTSGVRLEVVDQISGHTQVVMPTYRWTGGTE